MDGYKNVKYRFNHFCSSRIGKLKLNRWHKTSLELNLFCNLKLGCTEAWKCDN